MNEEESAGCLAALIIVVLAGLYIWSVAINNGNSNHIETYCRDKYTTLSQYENCKANFWEVISKEGGQCHTPQNSDTPTHE